MSDVIHLLPDSVANQIAAGEVIQRPASVIKELVENAVDAGATDIKIFIKDAGRTLIQVVDNGKGMSPTDARMAFERHATSKIRSANDLFTLHTMGFRGEALPSICAISQVELKTRTPDAPLGTRLLINASKVEAQEPCACDCGTNMMVKNIFFNVPVRRKFLKSDNVELSNIMREFERMALVNPGIRMQIDTNGRMIDLRAASFKQRILDIWKNNINPQLIPVEVATDLVKISGFISRPEFARRRNPLQYLIANGRNMRHPYFHKAIASCYDPLIAPDTQPCYFLRLTVDPDSIDVNIHPTKNEIKFEYEADIWQLLHSSVKSALGKYGAVPSIDFNLDLIPIDPLPEGAEPERPDLDIPDNYNPFASTLQPSAGAPGYLRPSKLSSGSNAKSWQPPHGNGKPARDNTSNWESLYDQFMRDSRTDRVGGVEKPAANSSEASADGTLPELDKNEVVAAPMCVQHALRYIITSSRQGLLIIDQHRAHVKVLYEQYIRRIASGGYAAQGVMFPESVHLDPEHRAALKEVTDELACLGFRLEYQEDDVWSIVGVPPMLKNVDPKDAVLRILDSVTDDSINYGKEQSARLDMMQRVALVMARSMAIKGGRKLSGDEMEQLVGDLFMLPEPAYTPTGNLIYKVIDDARLASFFA